MASRSVLVALAGVSDSATMYELRGPPVHYGGDVRWHLVQMRNLSGTTTRYETGFYRAGAFMVVGGGGGPDQYYTGGSWVPCILPGDYVPALRVYGAAVGSIITLFANGELLD